MVRRRRPLGNPDLSPVGKSCAHRHGLGALLFPWGPGDTAMVNGWRSKVVGHRWRFDGVRRQQQVSRIGDRSASHRVDRRVPSPLRWPGPAQSRGRVRRLRGGSGLTVVREEYGVDGQSGLPLSPRGSGLDSTAAVVLDDLSAIIRRRQQFHRDCPSPLESLRAACGIRDDHDLDRRPQPVLLARTGVSLGTASRWLGLLGSSDGAGDVGLGCGFPTDPLPSPALPDPDVVVGRDSLLDRRTVAAPGVASHPSRPRPRRHRDDPGLPGGERGDYPHFVGCPRVGEQGELPPEEFCTITPPWSSSRTSFRRTPTSPSFGTGVVTTAIRGAFPTLTFLGGLGSSRRLDLPRRRSRPCGPAA